MEGVRIHSLQSVVFVSRSQQEKQFEGEPFFFKRSDLRKNRGNKVNAKTFLGMVNG